MILYYILVSIKSSSHLYWQKSLIEPQQSDTLNESIWLSLQRKVEVKQQHPKSKANDKFNRLRIEFKAPTTETCNVRALCFLSYYEVFLFHSQHALRITTDQNS